MLKKFFDNYFCSIVIKKSLGVVDSFPRPRKLFIFAYTDRFGFSRMRATLLRFCEAKSKVVARKRGVLVGSFVIEEAVKLELQIDISQEPSFFRR